MEAATLPKKKTVNKGKIKKTLKNVLCRPDPLFWPLVSDSQKKALEIVINKYKVETPDFKKPQWKDIKMISKEKRPREPKIEKIDGLLFGTSECCNAVMNGTCSAVILEATVNPQIIVQPVIEACINSRVPVICVNGLRTLTTSDFGISTSCLGIKCDSLPDLQARVVEIANNFIQPQPALEVITESVEMKENPSKIEEPNLKCMPSDSTCPYLYRTSKKERVFNPSGQPIIQKNITDFRGQDFIEFNEKKDTSTTVSMDRKSYLRMVLKKISNNPKRVKEK